MEKTLNRKLTRWWMAFMAATLFFLLFLVVSGGGAVLCAILSIACLVIGTVLMMIANRCPYCKTMFRGGEWSKPNAGYCNKCGKLMEYDNSVAERESEREYRRQLRED